MKNLCLLLKGANDACGMGIISLETALLLNQLYLEMGVERPTKGEVVV